VCYYPIAKLLLLLAKKTKYGGYLIDPDYHDGGWNKELFIYSILIFILMIIGIILMNKKKKSLYFKNKKTRLYIEDDKLYFSYIAQLLVIFIAISSTAIGASEMTSRIMYIFMIFEIYSVPYLYSICNNKTYKKIYFISNISLALSFTIYFIIIFGWHQVLPYRWIFER
jgi:hypothetical protein